VEVGAADSAGKDAEESVARRERGHGDFLYLKRLVGGLEDCSSHGTSLFGLSFLGVFRRNKI
jgi:hypothetical protein